MWPPGSSDTVRPHSSVSLIFDRLTLKLVCESHLWWGTFTPNLGTLGLWILELFAMYATDRQTDGHTDGQKQRLLLLPFGGIIISERIRTLYRTPFGIDSVLVNCKRLNTYPGRRASHVRFLRQNLRLQSVANKHHLHRVICG